MFVIIIILRNSLEITSKFRSYISYKNICFILFSVLWMNRNLFMSEFQILDNGEYQNIMIKFTFLKSSFHDSLKQYYDIF